MSGVNPENERIKRRYFDFLKEGEGLQPVTIDHTSRAIVEYERSTGWRDFKTFSRTDAIAFRKSLLAGGGKQKAMASSRSTVHSKLLRVEKFHRWLAGEPGFRSRIRYPDVECFSLSLKDQRIAHRRTKEQPTPSLAQVLAAISAMRSGTDVELRDRAILVCLTLTASRVKALTTLQLKHIRRDALGIDFDASDVETKFGKTFTSFFAPFGDQYRQMLLDYAHHLRTLGWGDEDPLFPKTRQTVDAGRSFVIAGLTKEPWKDTDAARRVCRRGFAVASLPYYSPQAIRRMVIREGEKRCRSVEEFKAWSQNVAHEDTLTTFRNYGEVPFQRQAELVRQLGSEEHKRSELAELRRLLSSPLIQALSRTAAGD